jgi:hypothetical protein
MEKVLAPIVYREVKKLYEPPLLPAMKALDEKMKDVG